jgi:hypothetical protein
MQKVISKSRVKVTVSSMPGPWMSSSDPGGSRNNSLRRPGAGEDQIVITSRLTFEPITVTRMWNPDVDPAIWARLTAGDPFSDTTITMVDLDSDGIPAGPPDVYAGLAVESFSKTGGNANEDDESVELTITFTVPRKG